MMWREGFTACLSDIYAPAGIFYLNNYYYSALVKAILWFDCRKDSEGSSFLFISPDLECYSGEWWAYSMVAFVSIILYAVLLPMVLAKILLKDIPATGLADERMVRVYGFLYTRFRADVWFWEIAEIFRKAMFAFVIALALATGMEVLEQVVVVLLVVVVVALCLVTQPFNYHYHDMAEEITTFTEVILVVSSIIVISRDGPDDYPGVEPIAMFCMSFGFFVCIVCFWLDQHRINLANRLVRVRGRTHVSLPSSLFDLEFSNYFILRFLETASKESRTLFKTVEDMLMLTLLKDNKLFVETKASLAIDAIAKADIFLPERLLFQEVDRKSSHGIVAGTEVEHFACAADRVNINDTTNDVPFNMLFSDAINRTMPNWILQHAGNAQIQQLRRLKQEYYDFQNRTYMHTTALDKFVAFSCQSKPVGQKDSLIAKFRKAENEHRSGNRSMLITRSMSISGGVALRSTQQNNASNDAKTETAVGARTMNESPGESPGESPDQSFKNYQRTDSSGSSTGRLRARSRKASFEGASKLSMETLLSQLVAQTMSEYAIIVPVTGGLALTEPMVVTSPVTSKEFLNECAPKLTSAGVGSITQAVVTSGRMQQIDLLNHPEHKLLVEKNIHRFTWVVACPVLMAKPKMSASRWSEAKQTSGEKFDIESICAVLLVINKIAVERLSLGTPHQSTDMHVVQTIAAILAGKMTESSAASSKEGTPIHSPQVPTTSSSVRVDAMALPAGVGSAVPPPPAGPLPEVSGV